MEEIKTVTQEWIARRVQAVRGVYSAFQCLSEKGIELPDSSTAYQISCPFHGADNKPSARFYPSGSGRNYDILRCFKCRKNWDCVNLYAEFRGLRFMDALQELERRFRVRVPKKPDEPEYVDPGERGANYVSDKWEDVTKILPILEAKLVRLRDKAAMGDYVKFCRVLDAVQWDLDKANGKQTPQMVKILKKLREMMDSLPDDPLMTEEA